MMIDKMMDRGEEKVCIAQQITKQQREIMKKKNQCAGHISFRLICRSTIGSYEGYSSTCTPEHRPGWAVHGLTSFTAQLEC